MLDMNSEMISFLAGFAAGFYIVPISVNWILERIHRHMPMTCGLCSRESRYMYTCEKCEKKIGLCCMYQFTGPDGEGGRWVKYLCDFCHK